MTRRATSARVEAAPGNLRLTLRGLDPEVGHAAEFHRERVMAILRRRESLDSARELIGYDIVSATSEGVKRVRIVKTRSFNWLIKST